MPFPKPGRQERRSRSRVLTAFSSGNGPRNSAEDDGGSNEARQAVERGRRVPNLSRGMDAPSIRTHSRTTRSESRGTTEDHTRRGANSYQESPQHGSTSTRFDYRDSLPHYNSRGFRSGHPIDKYRPSYRSRRRSLRDRRCRQRSSHSPSSRASYRHHRRGDYRFPRRREKYGRPVYVNNSKNNRPPSSYHRRRSDYGPHLWTSAHPKTYFTRGGDRAQEIASRRFRSRSPSPPYESRYLASSGYPFRCRSRSREPRSPENSRDHLRLSRYEPYLDLREPSDGDLQVGTSIQSRGRRGSDGEVTPYGHNMRIDHQSVSQTVWRSNRENSGASKRTRANGTEKHSPQ